MAFALTRNDVLVRTRKTMCCFTRMADDSASELANGKIPCMEDIRKVELLAAYIEILRCHEPPITEVLATGSFTLTGTNGTVWITVNAVPITTAAISFITDPTITATLVASTATTDASTPNYTATSAAAVVTITAVAGSGDRANGLAIQAITTGDMAITGTVNMTGGVTGRVDGDNCFTLARAKGIYNKVEELGNLIFAAPGTTYNNPNLNSNILGSILTLTGLPINPIGSSNPIQFIEPKR